MTGDKASFTQNSPNPSSFGPLMNGGEIVLRALRDNGVEHIFGYPGAAVLPIYDEIFQQDEIKHLLVRHEQGAGHEDLLSSRLDNRLAPTGTNS